MYTALKSMIMSTYSDIWSLTKDLINKVEVCQRKMERKMLGIKQIDKIPNSTIREKTKVDDILKVITKTKWKWAGHVAGMNDNRWTVRCTEWQVRHGKRSRGRPRKNGMTTSNNGKEQHGQDKRETVNSGGI